MASILCIPPSFSLLLFMFFLRSLAAYSIGVNYGTIADNLPPPDQVAAFIKQNTTIDRVKIFDANPGILGAFANTGVPVTVTISNSVIIDLCKLPAAQNWVAENILPFHPQTKINYVAVGNEVMATRDKNLVAHLLPAMKSVLSALELANISGIQVVTPHSLGILSTSFPPSAGQFRKGFDRVMFAPMLDFHRRTKSPFMVNPYPFFAFSEQNRNYTLFQPNSGVLDSGTGLLYTNIFDAMLDAVYSAMKKLGYGDVNVVIGETGWPSVGAPNQLGVSLENAQSYNENLIEHVNSGKGTPLMPNRTFETYIFALFNENQKPNISEQNFGLFRPDFTPVYDVGILRDHQGVPPPPPGSPPVKPSPPPAPGKSWCVPKPEASDSQMQSNLDFACGSGVDCNPIKDGGECFDPNTVRSHAAFAMNAYYHAHGSLTFDCYFSNTGLITLSDPSYGGCHYEF